jgi:hypothetical protein
MESGGRITPLETPLVLQSVLGNVGFVINGRNLLPIKMDETPATDVPF